MSLKVYIDGEFVEEKDAKVSVFDHGLLYGDGVFEGIRAYSGKIFREQQHVKRLYNSAKAIMLEVPLPPGELTKAMYDTMAANDVSDAYVRVLVTRGAGDLGLDPRKCHNPCLIIIAASIELYPDEFYQNGLEIVTAPTRRISTDALNPRIKSCNYLNNILAKIEGIRSGCIEALMLNSKGEVAECTGDNIFIVNGSVLKTPPPEAGILEGVTRGVVINDLAGKLGLTALEVPLTRHDLFLADECFLTGTAAEIIPVVEIDGRKIAGGKPGKTTRQLLAEFRKLTLER